MVEKGAAYLVEGDAKRYIPIVPQEFCGNRIRRLEKELEWLQQNLPSESVEEDGYIMVEGKKNIADKIHHLLTGAEERVYFSCSKGCLEEFKEELLQLVRRGKKVVLITDEPFSMKEVIVYVTRKKEQQIGLIVDSHYVLSGEYGMGSMNTCVYSGQRNFVTVFKNALANADILNRCKSLRDYMTFVNKVRNKTDVYEMDVKEAVTEAVDESINAYFDTYIIHRRKSLLLYSLYGV